MYSTLSDHSTLLALHERSERARQDGLAARLRTARRWERRAASAARRARLARAAVG